MDATEAQLRFGASLTHSADPTHPAPSAPAVVSNNSTYNTVSDLKTFLYFILSRFWIIVIF